MGSVLSARETIARGWRESPESELLALAFAQLLASEGKQEQAVAVLDVTSKEATSKFALPSDKMLWAQASLLLELGRFPEANRLAAQLRDPTSRKRLLAALDEVELEGTDSDTSFTPPAWLTPYQGRLAKMLSHVPLRPAMQLQVRSLLHRVPWPSPQGERAARACVAAAVTKIIAAYGLPFPSKDAAAPFGVTPGEVDLWLKRLPKVPD
jgi:hypothetical protein